MWMWPAATTTVYIKATTHTQLRTFHVSALPPSLPPFHLESTGLLLSTCCRGGTSVVRTTAAWNMCQSELECASMNQINCLRCCVTSYTHWTVSALHQPLQVAPWSGCVPRCDCCQHTHTAPKILMPHPHSHPHQTLITVR